MAGNVEASARHRRKSVAPTHSVFPRSRPPILLLIGADMERAVPWRPLQALIEPHYPAHSSAARDQLQSLCGEPR
jgi:hypothetical protein